ncbi:hypothetical protein ACWGN5_41280 [Streptomyces sp. NPDC055815]
MLYQPEYAIAAAAAAAGLAAEGALDELDELLEELDELLKALDAAPAAVETAWLMIPALKEMPNWTSLPKSVGTSAGAAMGGASGAAPAGAAAEPSTAMARTRGALMTRMLIFTSGLNVLGRMRLRCCPGWLLPCEWVRPSVAQVHGRGELSRVGA